MGIQDNNESITRILTHYNNCNLNFINLQEIYTSIIHKYYCNKKEIIFKYY